MSSQRAVTQREMQFAYYFLQRMGANLSNSYLITAVVSWLRAEVGYNLGSMYNKNNPLNIRRSPFAIGYRKAGSNGHFALFASLKDGAYASADLLISAGHDWRGYWRAVEATHRSAKTDKEQQQQALDFIEGIALSKWDAGHYGLKAGERTVAGYNPAHVSIIGIWIGITGKLPAIRVDDPNPPKENKKAKAFAKQPPLNPPSAKANYIDPFQAGGFYRASRPKSDLGNLPTQ